MKYKGKYIKYKSKYLMLKNIQYGGVYEHLLEDKSIISRDEMEKMLFDTIMDDIKNKGYINVTSETYDAYIKLMMTFEYIWQSEIMCVFVYIKNGKLMKFVPLINLHGSTTVKDVYMYTVEQRIMGKLNQISKEVDVLGPPEDDPNKIILDKCMVYGFKGSNEKYFTNATYFHYPLYLDMFYKYCESGVQPNLTTMFFINLFDHPLIKNKILQTNKLLSNDTQDIYSDIEFPFADIWMFYSPRKIGNMDIRSHYDDILPIIKEYLSMDETRLINNFDQRIPKMIFRGTLTGCYPENEKINTRLEVISTIHNKIPNYKEHYDVGLSSLFKGLLTENHLYFKDKDPRNDVEKLSYDFPELQRYIVDLKPMEQIMSGYQFVLSLDGFVSAWRLPYELIMGNVVFVYTKYKSWFSDLLKDRENCIIINDISNIHKIFMDIKNDKNLCRKISINANRLGKRLFDKKFIFERLHQSVMRTV